MPLPLKSVLCTCCLQSSPYVTHQRFTAPSFSCPATTTSTNPGINLMTKGYLAQFKERDLCSYLLFPLCQQVTNPFHTLRKSFFFPSKDRAESALKKLMYATLIRPPVSQHPLTPADKTDGFARHHYLEMFYFPTISLSCKSNNIHYLSACQYRSHPCLPYPLLLFHIQNHVLFVSMTLRLI